MYKMLQRLLLVVGVLALIALLTEIALSVGATMHGNTPARIVHVTAGPYHLQVSLYKDPANAGFALPFAIAPEQPVQGTLTYDVTSLPSEGISATPVHASLSPDANVPNGVQGTAEITVQGQWGLDILVNGPAGSGEVNVPIIATAPPAIPDWLGWLIGFIPLYGLLAFLLLQRGRKTRGGPAVTMQ
ncbi:MAG TPA: hypothetical protein VEV19_14985, partial [Ktedonobacteraceae bacterium]|nr:hypothetical protein [Ktedonobacteraceae bacterium]